MVEQPGVSPKYPVSALIEAFGSNLEFSRDLAPLTSFKTGGPARYFLAAEEPEEIVRAVKAAERLKIPHFLMGSGSNLLVSDDGFEGLVIRVNVLGLKMLSETEIECGAGEELMDLVNYATENSLTGLEFAAGIWGTVGGAIYGNAGAFGGEIGSILTHATLVDRQGKMREVEPGELGFNYRHSVLKETREIVVQARLKLSPGDRKAVQARVDEILSARAERHPVDGLSAGCFFKNIPDPEEKYGKLPAGRLLEEIGAKGMSVGGARVYEKHANIIVNSGDATAKDIRQLADILKKKVRDKFGIDLQEEVQHLGRFQ
jgi:UDP-N-acetylmuramate dehydrogenase